MKRALICALVKPVNVSIAVNTFMAAIVILNVQNFVIDVIETQVRAFSAKKDYSDWNAIDNAKMNVSNMNAFGKTVSVGDASTVGLENFVTKIAAQIV